MGRYSLTIVVLLVLAVVAFDRVIAEKHRVDQVWRAKIRRGIDV